MAKKKKDDKPDSKDGTSLILKNKKAFFEYEILNTLECGLVLHGTEVKSLRDKNVSFADSYVTAKDGKLQLIGLNISEYMMGNRFNHITTRTRKLLAHKREIQKLSAAVLEKGLTLVPIKLYWKRGMAKVEIGLGRGKAKFDKRESIKNRDLDRERARYLRK